MDFMSMPFCLQAKFSSAAAAGFLLRMAKYYSSNNFYDCEV